MSIRSRSIVSRMFSGSNFRRSTIVEAVSIASPKCAKPHWWNSGGATSTFSRPRSGIAERIATAAPIPGEPREAPLGVPVVPEVRIVWRPSWSGGSGVTGSPPSISSSSVGSAISSPSSRQATKPLRRYSAFESSSANSAS